MQPATTFKSIKLTLCTLLEVQIFVTCISQQGQSINGELLPALYWQVRFFTHDIIVFTNWKCIFGKTLRYSLEHAINSLHSKRGPILMHGTSGQSSGYCLCMNYVSMFCEHVLLIGDHAC